MNFKKLTDFQTSRNTNFYRKTSGLVNVILVLHQLFILCCEAYYLDNNPYRHKEVLGPKASFVVEWSVDWKERVISFQVSAETKGWVGFGLSRDGRMFNSDVVIGGVGLDGRPYFDDGHIGQNRSVKVDKRQDWKLNGAWEKGKRTYLSFSRAFDTCDATGQDYTIDSSLVVLIWAYGETDRVEYHMKRRGSTPVYLLDPQISEEIAHDHYRQLGPHSNLYLVQRWAFTSKILLPAKPSSAWCSVQRGPRLLMRHDIVGMGALLPSEAARDSVQQMLIYRCTPPQQQAADTFFEPYARLRGEECYLNKKRTLPVAFCRELIYVWGRGSKPFYFPEDIGIPIGESQAEYYLLETQYDNPKRASVEIEAGVEIIFSHRQKPNSASMIQVGYGPFGIFMVPPKSMMNIHGSCGPKCTATMLPKEGANIFAAMLYSRSLGRSIRLRHIRAGEELPWILRDDNYDSEFQQIRLLPQERNILPGDQIITQCRFDSSDRNQTSFSGFSSQHEACLAYVYVSRRIPFFRCTSEYPADRLLQKYGVNNFTWDLTWQERYVTSPKKMEGAWLGDVIDEELRLHRVDVKQLELDFKHSPHYESCPNFKDMSGQKENQIFKIFTNDWESGKNTPVLTHTPYLSSAVSYPEHMQEYLEPRHCSSVETYKPDPMFLEEPSLPPKPIVDFSFEDLPNPPAPSPLRLRPKPIVDFSFEDLPKPPTPSALRMPPKHIVDFSFGDLPKPRPLPPPPPPLPVVQKPVEFDRVLLERPKIQTAAITAPLVEGLVKVQQGSEGLKELADKQPIKAFFDRLADLISPDSKHQGLKGGRVKYKSDKKKNSRTKTVEAYFNEFITPEGADFLGLPRPKSVFTRIYGPGQADGLLKAAGQSSTNGFSYQEIHLARNDILKKRRNFAA